MPNTVTIGEVMLLGGVETTDFEKFAAEEFNAFGHQPGAGNNILKGVRGDRTGGYLHLVSGETVNGAPTRNKRSEEPAGRQLSARDAGDLHIEVRQVIRSGLGQATAAKWDTWAQAGLYTAYRSVGKEMTGMPEEVLIEPVTLRPGVTEADFERFVTERYYAMSRLSGEEGYLLKGVRGDRADKYMLLIAYDSVEVRNHRSTSGGELSREMREWADSSFVQTTVAIWDSLAHTGLYTSYVVLGR